MSETKERHCTFPSFIRLQFQNFFNDDIEITNITLRSVLFEFLTLIIHVLIINYILLLLEFYKYKTNDRKSACFNILKVDIKKTRNFDTAIAGEKNEYNKANFKIPCHSRDLAVN